MSLLDKVAGQLGGALGGGPQSALRTGLTEMLGKGGSGGGLSGLVQAFQAKGLGDIVASWVGTGSNLPVSPAQIQEGAWGGQPSGDRAEGRPFAGGGQLQARRDPAGHRRHADSRGEAAGGRRARAGTGPAQGPTRIGRPDRRGQIIRRDEVAPLNASCCVSAARRMRSAQAVAVSIGTANGKAVSLSGATCSGRSCGPGVPRDAQRSWAR